MDVRGIANWTVRDALDGKAVSGRTERYHLGRRSATHPRDRTGSGYHPVWEPVGRGNHQGRDHATPPRITASRLGTTKRLLVSFRADLSRCLVPRSPSMTETG